MTTKVEKLPEPQTLEEDPSHFSATLNNDGTVETEDLTPDSGNEDKLRFDALAAVQAALSAEPTEFENQIKLGLADRIQDAVERKRDEVAQAIFGPQDSQDEADDPDAQETPEVEDEDNQED